MDYATPVEEQEAQRALLSLAVQSDTDWANDLPPLPGGWGGDGGDDPGVPLGEPVVYPDGSLWLSMAQLTNGVVPLAIHGTTNGWLYEIQSEVGITDSAWASEGGVLGAAGQDWTPAVVNEGDRTNALFFRAKCWGAGDEYGVPWAWYAQEGLNPLTPGIGGQDANGDGLPNWQEYLWGSDRQRTQAFGVWVSSPAGYCGIP